MLYLDVKNAFDDLAQLLYLKHQTIRQITGKASITSALLNLTNSFFQFSSSLRFIDRDDCDKTLIAALEVVNMDMREASDPRDHYFGILGVVSRTSIESQELRSLSYQHSTVDIYTAMAHTLYKEHGLEVLAYCYAIRFERSPDGENNKTASVSRLPSWVPNWGGGWIAPLQDRLIFRNANRYRASSLGGETPSASFAIDGASLKVKGILLDRVRIIVPSWDNSHEGLPRRETMRRCWAPWISVILDLLGDSDIYPDQRARLIAIFRTSSADCVRGIPGVGGLRRTTLDHRTLFDGLVSEYLLNTTGDTALHESPTDICDYIDMTSRPLRHWKVIITEKGHLGLGRPTCRPGDAVCIINAASTPYILRPITSNEEVQKSTLVGEAYIHGFMDGEFVPTAINTRTFALV